MRGHGESSHSSRHLYSLETLVEDLHELVVRLSLNGRDWGGAWTRPWVMMGKGMGAAVAVAYAVRHVGRVAGLVLWEYDPEWPKDRLNFYPYQAAHFANQMAIGTFYNEKLQLAVCPPCKHPSQVLCVRHYYEYTAQLFRVRGAWTSTPYQSHARTLIRKPSQDDTKYMSLTFTNQAYHVDIMEDAKGCKFKMDPYFFVSDFNAGIAWTMLRAAASKCRIMLLYTENSREWSYTRAMEVVNSLQQGDALSVQCAIVNRGTSRLHAHSCCTGHSSIACMPCPLELLGHTALGPRPHTQPPLRPIISRAHTHSANGAVTLSTKERTHVSR